MLHAIFDGLIGGLLGPSVGRRLGKLSYVWAFLLGFLTLPVGLFFYLLYRAGWAKMVYVFSSMPVEKILEDTRFFLPFCFIFGVGAVFLAALGRAAASKSDSISGQKL